MLEELRTFLARTPTSSRISMPRLNSYLYNLNHGVERLILRNDRFVTDPIPSSGIDFLNSLITRADIPYLLKYRDNFSRLSKVNREYKSAVYGDFLRQYPVHSRCFISGKRGTSEYLLITDDFDLVDHLPLEKENFSEWLGVRPLRMLSNTSPELLLDITTSRLKYKATPPREVVFSINIIKLLMSYTTYRLSYPEEFTTSINNYPFIYKACLLPLLYDNTKDWITKIICDMMILKHIDPSTRFDDSVLTLGEKSTFAQGGRQSALLELEDIITKCAKGEIRADEAIMSICISPGRNLHDEINWIMDSNYVGVRGNLQYRWAEFEREYAILVAVVGLYGLQPESSRTKEFKKLFNIISNRMRMTKFWTSAGNPYLAQSILNKFDVVCDLI